MQKYKIKRALGDGTFGTVFEAINPNNQIVAIKKMKQKYKDWDECCTLRQIKSLRKLDHPNIIKLKQVILANGDLYMVFDYLQTNLLQVYSRSKQAGRTMTQNQIKSIFYKMVQGLAYLHKNGYFHRDLKPENVLCHNLDVKICDFGLAREIRSRPPFTDYVSTRWYRAPQLLLRSTTYNSPVDIFALACIVIELFTEEPLFPGVNQIDTLNKIVDVLGTPKKADWPEGFKLASAMRYDFPEAKGKGLFQIIPNASVEIVQLLQQMLCYSSRKRPSANQILKHKYFEGFAPISEKTNSEHQEMKISFYDKNVVQMPKNMKIQNSKQVQMRKSLYKFGQSFTSSFHKQKQTVSMMSPPSVKKTEKKQEQEKSFKKQMNPNTSLQKVSKKNKFIEEDHDGISKKFDQMQQILLELKKKQQMKNTNTKKQKTQRNYETKPIIPTHLSSTQNQQEELRLRMFSLDGMAGTKSIPNINAAMNTNSMNPKATGLKGPLLNYKN